jgi:hypothetical protein
MPELRQGASRLRLIVALCLAPSLFPSCAQSGGALDPDGALARLEQFGFVPKGKALISLDGSRPIEIEEPLLVGMYEVTRGQFLRYREAAAPALDPLLQSRMRDWKTTDNALPVSFVTREEAGDYAHWMGARLPTSSEWLFCAISPRTFAYPWADSWQQGRANTLDLGLTPYAPTPVGTFEGGRTATRLYDMLGNVWEWVSDGLQADTSSASSATALGGSYLRYKQEIHRDRKFFAEPLESATRLEDVGFRVCATARTWFETHAAELERGKNVHQRLQAIGRRWGAGAVPLLSEMEQTATGSARRSLEAILSGARG